MIEIRFNPNTGDISGCWGSRLGNHSAKLKDWDGWEIVTLDIEPINIKGKLYINGELIDKPGYDSRPPLQTSTRFGQLVSVNIGVAKPATVRVQQGTFDYDIPCYVTQTVKKEFQAGAIVLGDYLLVDFLEHDGNKPMVIAKVFKSW